MKILKRQLTKGETEPIRYEFNDIKESIRSCKLIRGKSEKIINMMEKDLRKVIQEKERALNGVIKSIVLERNYRIKKIHNEIIVLTKELKLLRKYSKKL